VALAEILRLSNEEKVIAIGEIGLDYHYDFSPRDKQKQVFQELVTAAVQVGRPVVIHSREAEEDTLAILQEAGRPPLRGVMHSFTGSMQMMRRAVEMGLHIGITGIVTFKNAQPLRDVVKEIPPSQLLIETDSPYLAPEPHRGKRNEPAFVAEVCRAVAEVRGVKENTVARRSKENFRHLFGLED
jgi:TatD DNase family protein